MTHAPDNRNAVGTDLCVRPNANNNHPVRVNLCVRQNANNNYPNHGATPNQGEHTGSPLRFVVEWFKTMITDEYIFRGRRMTHIPSNHLPYPHPRTGGPACPPKTPKTKQPRRGEPMCSPQHGRPNAGKAHIPTHKDQTETVERNVEGVGV